MTASAFTLKDWYTEIKISIIYPKSDSEMK
jgi:hypothetical protein